MILPRLWLLKLHLYDLHTNNPCWISYYCSCALTSTKFIGYPCQSSTARSNLRQSWGQAFVALVTFAVCIQMFWSVQSSPQSSPVHSPVQSRVQVLQRPDKIAGPNGVRFRGVPLYLDSSRWILFIHILS